ncbi:MAG: hypothetical protein FJ296_02375 [Planctomycetes bacterium]|nr:hypothetical protein [Planctomycetota bacterium]
MMSHTMTNPTCTALRSAFVAALVLALVGAPAHGQDGDDDGVLPKQDNGASSGDTGGSSGSTAPGALGLSGTLGGELLDPAQARLVFTAAAGPLLVDTEAAPEAATFLASGQLDFAIDDSTAEVQGDGQLVLQAGLVQQLVAAPDSLARMALIVAHEAGADVAALLSGAQAPSLVLALGDLPVLDLAKAQAAVSRHEAQLPGLAVSVVLLSVDASGQLHASAATLDPAGGPVGILID